MLRPLAWRSLRSFCGRPSLPCSFFSRSSKRNQGLDTFFQSLSVDDGVARMLTNLIKIMPGTSSEMASYLSEFSAEPLQKFAVIKVGGSVVQEDLASLASAVSFLVKLGLYPIIVHGAGPQLNEELESANIEPAYVEGIRVTDPDTLQVALKVFQRENAKIVAALEKMGVHARPIISGVFQAEILDEKTYGLVGQVTEVNEDPIVAALKAHAIPVVTSVGQTVTGQALNVNADIAARQLAVRIKPMKVVYLNTTGGLIHGETGEVISVINLKEDYENLLSQSWVKYGTRLKIKEMKALLDGLPSTSSLAITRSTDLLKELFTRAGAGTIIRKGERMVQISPDKVDTLDVPRLVSLIETAFGASMSSDYISKLLSGSDHLLNSIYVTDSYLAAAVILNAPVGKQTLPYMDKFAVSESVQGEGRGEMLWQQIRRDYPRLFWRSRVGNPINSWYFQQADGSCKSDDWVTFWYGFDHFHDVAPCIEYALNLEPTIMRTSRATAVSPSASFPRQQAPNFSTSTSNQSRLRVGLIGARGYTGAELMKLIFKHPHLDLGLVSSRQLEGEPVSKVVTSAPNDLNFCKLEPADCKLSANEQEIDIWILALPNQASSTFVQELTGGGVRPSTILDLSADYRFDTSSDWIYGLPEVNRELLRGCTRISNPGCYATGSQLSIRPLLNQLQAGVPPHIFGVSGYSGAGTTPSDKNDPAVLNDNLLPYSQVDHIHEREISFQLQTPVNFLPHVGQFFRGISLSISMALEKPTSSDAVREHFAASYQTDKLIKVVKRTPQVKENAGQHFVQIGGFHLSKDGKRVVLNTTIDNLLKGAATQAIQNINLAHGFQEYAAIL